MLPTWLSALGGVLVGLGAIVAPLLVFRAGTRTSRAQSEDAHLKRQDGEIKDLRERMETLEADSRVVLNYVYLLRKHIADGKPPPPPDWPSELDRR